MSHYWVAECDEEATGYFVEAPTPRKAAEQVAAKGYEAFMFAERLWVVPVDKITLGTQMVEKFAGQSAFELDLEDYFCNHEEPLLDGTDNALNRLAGMIDEALEAQDITAQDLYKRDEDRDGAYFGVKTDV